MVVRTFFFIVFLFITFCKSKKSYQKRLTALWNLEEMTQCKLHCSAFLTYNDYGCWCGPGGSGEPMDGIDRCCMEHDHCYDYAVDHNICFDVPEEYVDDYSWSCSANGTITCADNLSDCQKILCWCDMRVVSCWGNFPHPTEKLSCRKNDSRSDNESSSSRNMSTIMGIEDVPKNNFFSLANFLYSAWMFIPTALFRI